MSCDVIVPLEREFVRRRQAYSLEEEAVVTQAAGAKGPRDALQAFSKSLWEGLRRV